MLAWPEEFGDAVSGWLPVPCAGMKVFPVGSTDFSQSRHLQEQAASVNASKFVWGEARLGQVHDRLVVFADTPWLEQIRDF